MSKLIVIPATPLFGADGRASACADGSSVMCRGAAAYEMTGDTPPGRIQLLPCGEFAALDGRPGSLQGVSATSWRCTAADAAAIMALWRSRKSRTVIDYEHQTLHAESNGQPAPAAGWIVNLVWEEGRGLYADVEWTARAREYLRAGEYRYISPTFCFDRASGAITRLVSAALTNHPGLDGMEPAQARENTEETPPMKKETLDALRVLLALPENADETAMLAALKDQPEGKSLHDLLAAKDAEIAALKSADPDPEKFVPAALLTAEREKAAALSARVAEMEKNDAAAGMESEIRAALADGRLPKSCEGWARKTAQSHPESLRSYLKSAVAVAALSAMQTHDRQPEGEVRLTDEESYACAQTGISEKDFLAQKHTKKEAE